MKTSSLSLSMNSSHPDIEECHYLQGLAWKKIYLTEHTYRNLVALICVDSLAIIPTILLNALVIFVVATRNRLQTNSNILLACLAGTDLLAGLVAQPISIAVDAQRIFGDEAFCPLETVRTIVIFSQCYASLNHLVLISVDRYVAIKNPLRYQEIVTKPRLKRAVLVACVITVVLTIQEIGLAVMESGTKIYSIYWALTGVLTVFIACLYIGAICYCHGYVFSETRRQKKRLQTEQLSQEEAERIKKDNRAANTLAIILGALMITYLPLVTLILVLTTYNDLLNPSFITIFSSWAATSVLLGSLANPIIYCWRNTKLRHAFLEICHVRQPELNRAPAIEMIEIQRHRPEIQPSDNEAFSMAVASQEPVLLSFRYLDAEEIVHIEEISN